jgi:hypothetical protein
MESTHDAATGNVTVSFTTDEALVLSEWLDQRTTHDDFPFEHQAEQRVIWNLTAVLERALAAPFTSDYGLQLDEARSRVAD